MKHRNVLSAVSAVCAMMLFLVFAASPAVAQRMRMTPEERAKALKDSLSLTDEQTKQVTVIYTDSQDKMMDAFQSGEGREKVQGIMKETDDKIMKLLNDEQKKKYEQMIKNRPARGMGRRRG